MADTAYAQGSAQKQQSGEQPPAQPSDKGIKPEQAGAGPGIEPPSGQQGAGTPGKPFDQGNQPGLYHEDIVVKTC